MPFSTNILYSDKDVENTYVCSSYMYQPYALKTEGLDEIQIVIERKSDEIPSTYLLCGRHRP